MRISKIFILISMSISLFLIMAGIAIALTCEFSGWDIPKLSDDNTIFLDGEKWIAIDSQNNKEYTRRILKESSEGIIPHLDPNIPMQRYLDLANDFLERNDDDLKIEDFSQLTLRDDIEVPKTVDFLGESQYCYNIPVIGTFAGALEYSDDEIYSLTSRWYAPVIIETIEPELTPEEIGIDADSKLKILPRDDKFVLVYEVDNDGDKKLFDANTGDAMDNPDAINFGQAKTKIRIHLDGQSIFLIAMLAIIVFSSAFYINYLRQAK